MSDLSDIPEEIQQKLENFDEALGEMEDVLNIQFAIPHAKLSENLTPIDRAKLDLANAYALNSIFFQYLTTRGVSIKEHPLKFELDRIKECMNRVKDVEAKQKAPKLNKDAAKRFVRSALWQQAQQKTHKTEVGKGGESSTAEAAPSGSDEGEPVSKRKK